MSLPLTSPDSSRARPIDWVFSLPFLAAFALILLVFDPLQRVARLFGSRPHEIVAGLLQISLVAAFRLCGTRLEVERSPAVEPRTSYIIIANLRDARCGSHPPLRRHL